MANKLTKSEGRKGGRPSAIIPRLLAIYDFIAQYQEDYHTSPSRREFTPLGINSTSLSGYYLDKMEILHMIAPRIKGRARSIFLLPLDQADSSIAKYVKSTKTKKEKK